MFTPAVLAVVLFGHASAAWAIPVVVLLGGAQRPPVRWGDEPEIGNPPTNGGGQSPQPKGGWGSEAACNCPCVRSTR